MGLIELCLLSVISPQTPEATAPPPTPQPVVTETSETATTETEVQDPQPGEAAPVGDPLERLQAAEKAGAEASTLELAQLATGEDATVAARAAWLLATSDNPEHGRALENVAELSPHAEARLQAMQHLWTVGKATSLKTAVARLQDDDRRIRTLAVKLLGKLRNPLCQDALLALVDDASQHSEPGPATDVQAAIVTLTDFGSTDFLLRIATSIEDSTIEDTGEALVFAFQTLSPKLEDTAETTLLVAVLDHREAMLRRYAITRLTELGNPTALSALEGRLGSEGPELRPLVENALAQIRHDHQAPPADEAERAKNNAKVLWARTTRWWNNLEPVHQGIAAGTPVLLLFVLWMMRRTSKRRAAQEAALATAAWVQPSDEFSEEQEYDDDGEDFEGEEEFEEEYEDGDYEDEPQPAYDDDGDEQFDTSGWEDDEAEDETLLAEGGLDDERFR